MNCPRKKIMRGAKPQEDQSADDYFIPSPLSVSLNSAGIKNIHCNSGVPVPLKLLAIEEEVGCDADKNICENKKSSHNGLVCYIGHELFAHLYITTENNKADIKHYIIAFVEGTKIGRYEELLNLLYHTIGWLKIENESPHFYIYYYGKQPVIENTLNDACGNISRKLKSRLSNYKSGESFCHALRVRKDVVDFTISDSNPYHFNVS